MKEQDFLHCLLLQLKIRHKLWMQDQEAANEEIKLSPYLTAPEKIAKFYFTEMVDAPVQCI
jgi:hypothetical protein